MASISNGALKDNVNVEIYYYGTHQNWLDIETDSDNDEVNTSKRYYFAEASKDVTEEYDFWGFKPDGSVAKWLWNEQEDVWYLA